MIPIKKEIEYDIKLRTKNKDAKKRSLKSVILNIERLLISLLFFDVFVILMNNAIDMINSIKE